MKKYKKTLFLFRRDLRIEDNNGLNKALQNSEQVIPAFIFDPRQKDHPYFSGFSFNFLRESLIDLIGQLEGVKGHLYIFQGKPIEIIAALKNEIGIDAVVFNRDYTPFSAKRDLEIKNFCGGADISVHRYADALLNEPENCLKGDGTPYTVFTPFFKKNSQIEIAKPAKLAGRNFFNDVISIEQKSILENDSFFSDEKSPIRGGRKVCLKMLGDLQQHKKYSEQRDFPVLDATTHLSAHNKFGTCSIREVYHTMVDVLGVSHALVRQLYWRDFFTHIAFHFPHVFGESFNRNYDKVDWQHDKKKFSAWCKGETGFPIVDAGMRELNQTGFMHNRVRMIVASFLTKDLHIDWRLGEKYFATKLVDYDPCVNNGSWQWAASSGCDAQPYFRIFNPWLQQEKFDKECLYIKKWLPELKALTPKEIHSIRELGDLKLDYPRPMVEHDFEKKLTLEMFEVLKD